MEKKQTAVDWYFDKIKSHFEHDGDLFETACFTYAIAKEKEKEQTMNDWAHGVMSQDNMTAELYYEKTYGKKTDRS